MKKTISVSSQNISRFDEIDVAKGIGILLVTFFHVHTKGAACTVVYSFHMPLFFFISGFLFNREKYPSINGFIKKRAKTLIAPYLLFTIGALLLNIFINDIIQGDGLSSVLSLNNAKNFAEIFIVRQSSRITFNTPMWFVPSLFTIEIIYYLLSKIKSTPVLCVIIALLAGTGWYLCSDYCFFDASFLPWNLPSALFALSFYFTGNKTAPYIKKFLANSKPYVLAVILAVCIAADIPLAMLNGDVSLGSRHLSNGFILFITGLIGTAGILSLSKLISKSKVLRWYGKNSFYLMSTQIPVLSLLISFWKKVEEKTGFALYNKNNLLECIPPFIITLAICSAFIFVYVALKKRMLKKERKFRA